MLEYSDYLAANVLHESRPISYRLLSAALKVHVHTAKQMLYDFHATQNAKKPGSVHATYLVTGTKLPEPGAPHVHADDDTTMRSSPPLSSIPDQHQEADGIKVTSITLAKEEHLDEMKAQFADITSMHVFSLEPGPLKDLRVLADCNREILSKYAVEDPLEAWKTYGTIRNPNVKRRSGRGTQPPSVPAATTAAAKAASRQTTAAIAMQKEASRPARSQGSDAQKGSRPATPQVDAAAVSGKKNEKKAPNLKREASNIFKSFANAKPKKTPAASAPATESTEPSAAEDKPMRDVSDEEGDDDVIVTESHAKSKDVSDAARKAKAEREEKLRQMMEEDGMWLFYDEPMADAPPATAEEPEEPEDATLDRQPEPEEENQETVTVTGGRRRGRRRVMKKKTVKDEEGYLVTREEPVWESFSEDEPEPKKAKTSNTTTAIKGKKGGGGPKQGQGSIMAFFGKK